MVTLSLFAICHGTFMSSSTYASASFSNQRTAQDVQALPMIINTRPVERAAPLTQYLRAAGRYVVEMPMLSLQSRPTTAQDLTLMRQWLAGDYKALVIVSPTAAASGVAVWQTLARQAANTDSNHQQSAGTEHAPSHLIAVGEATAAVLHAHKPDTASYQVLQPKVANNEGMLAMPEIDSLQAGDKLLVWRGLGGRRLLVDTLQARGVQIDSIAWYERTLPIDAMAQYEQWLSEFLAQELVANGTIATTTAANTTHRTKPIVVISSGTAFEHWASIVTAAAKKDSNTKPEHKISAMPSLQLTDFMYVVLGERLANIVAEQQLSYWRVEDLAPETIFAAINAKPYYSSI